MSDQTQDDRLWTDDRINSYAWNASSAWEARRIFEAMVKVRDDYEQRLAAVVAERDQLRQELAAIKASGYIPLRDSVGGALITREWDTPEENEAWLHLEDETSDE